VYIPFDKTKDVLIVELKYNSSASKALEQIKTKKYFDLLGNWQGGILFVGVNYDTGTKKHECRIERFVK
jgi:formate/nitrite transporter FocA (FNT family)